MNNSTPSNNVPENLTINTQPNKVTTTLTLNSIEMVPVAQKVVLEKTFSQNSQEQFFKEKFEAASI